MPNALTAGHACLVGDVGERAVAVVLVERVLQRRVRLVEIRRPAVDQEDVGPAIVVEIDRTRRRGPSSPADIGSPTSHSGAVQLMPLTDAGISSNTGAAAPNPRRNGMTLDAVTEPRRVRNRRRVKMSDGRWLMNPYILAVLFGVLLWLAFPCYSVFFAARVPV